MASTVYFATNRIVAGLKDKLGSYTSHQYYRISKDVRAAIAALMTA